jgi:putative DNA primase/helicase
MSDNEISSAAPFGGVAEEIDLASHKAILDIIEGDGAQGKTQTVAETEDDAEETSKRQRRTPQRDKLLGIAAFVDLWHDANRVAYASFPVRGHTEHWPVRSRDFRMWLSGEFFRETGLAIGGTALEDGLRILEARAINEGPLHEPCVRVGRANGRLYLDLADEPWRAVEITKDAWNVVMDPPVRFLRTPAMRRLPEPERGGMLESLRSFLNVSDGDAKLIVAWIVASMRDTGPYPILIMNGEHGAGKSVMSRVIRSLVDPSAAPIRAVPKDERDIVVSASNTHMLAFDNLSGMPPWLGDALCRLSTGGGFATRALHTDREEMIFEGMKPILLNGIPSLADRADLASRAVTVQLQNIDVAARRPEDEFWAEFEVLRPAILGALLDGVSAALRDIGNVKLRKLQRMADFTKWATAAESGLGWEPGTFAALYEANCKETDDVAFEADLLAVAIRDYVTPSQHPYGWRGTATQLSAALNERAPEAVRRSRRWPETAQKLGNAFTRIMPLLRSRGFTVEKARHGQREITIIAPGAASDEPIPS